MASMEDKTGQDLIKSINNLIKVMGTGKGGFKNTNTSQNKNTPNNSYDTKNDKKKRDSAEALLKLETAMQKIIKKNLELEDARNKAIRESIKVETKATKLANDKLEAEKKLGVSSKKATGNQKIYLQQQQRINALEKIKLKQTESYVKLLELQKKDTKNMSNTEKDAHNLKIKNLKTETDKLTDQYKTRKQSEDKAEKERTKSEDRRNAVLNTTKNLANKASESVLGFIKTTISSAFEQDSIMSKLSANYALTRDESGVLKQNIMAASLNTAFLGVKTEDLVKLQGTYTDELGRSVMLNADGLESLSNMAVATGLGVEGAAKMAANMEMFGLNAKTATEQVQDLVTNSKKSGMSSSVMTAKLLENLKIGNSYTFKNGLKGVADMTVYSEKLKINMSTIASLADKVSSPEGAIETASKLQVLGGSFAQMADPMKLLTEGITDMEGLTKTYSKMLDGVTNINKETGEVTINGYDRLRVKAAAEAMGVNFDEMMQSTRLKGKRTAIEGTFGITPTIKNTSPETRDLIASLSEFDTATKKFKITVGGKNKLVTSLTPDDIDKLQPKEDTTNMRSIAENTLGISDIVRNGFNALVQTLMPELISLIGDFTKVILPPLKQLLGDAGSSSGQSRALPTIKGAGIGGAIGGVGGGILGGLTLGPAGIIPGAYIGAGLGAAAGGIIGNRFGTPTKANDMVIPSGGGSPIMLNSKDDVFAMKPGGAIANVLGSNNIGVNKNSDPLSNIGDVGSLLFAKASGAQAGVLSSNPDVNKTYGGVAQGRSSSGGGNNSMSGNIAHNIQGSISLIGGNSSTKISASELVKDQQFVRELTRIIGNQMNRDNNGGRYSGALTNDSF